GLASAANNDMTKPYKLEELLARIRAHLKARSFSDSKNEIIKHRHLEINPLAREVKSHGEIIYLTQKEYYVLLYLINHKNQALSREQIIESVWGYEIGRASCRERV